MKYKHIAHKQIKEYLKEGIFLSPKDHTNLALIDSWVFDQAYIRASQGFVWASGVKKWQRRIEGGLTASILIDLSEARVIDGHHRLNAYIALGFNKIPCILI